jgi:hypothetical protein
MPPGPDDEAVRWAPGTTFVPTADGWLVHGPDEDFMIVEVPDADRSVVADLIAGRVGAAAAAARVPAVADLIAELAVPSEPAGPGPRVLVQGAGPLVEPLLRLLAEAGFAVRRGDGPEPGTHVLVACAEHLPDAAWLELDDRCRAAGIPWHRGHGEGRRWYVGPFTAAEGGAGYRDVRLRRLAACPWPDELAAYWSHLDAGGRPVAPADPQGAAAAAAFLAADLMAWRAGQVPSGAGVQVGIDLFTGEVRRHPVLPVPQGLMREAPA